MVPKLEEFRAPPVFNMQMVYEPTYKQEEKKVEKKIVSKDYNYLRIQEENNELEISSISNDEWNWWIQRFLIFIKFLHEVLDWNA